MKLKRKTKLQPLVLKLDNESDTTVELTEMATILFYLRIAQKKYVSEYCGGNTTLNKKNWETAADNFINNHISIDEGE